MRTYRILGLINLVLTLALCGCEQQKLISNPETRRPDWTYTPPSPSQGKVYFVGRSLAVNVLDERNAMNQAMDDAIYQIARSAGAEITGSTTIIDSRSGEAIRGQERTDQSSREEIRVDVNGTVIGVRQEDTYRERYSVREEFLGDEYKRYTYYVLVSVSEQELNALQESVKKKSQLD